jgi:pSer/pThr/pTyr-binding forkhead associated (FHA) protein
MEQFLQNCELSSLEFRIQRAGELLERRCLAQPYLLIGRDPRNDIRLDDDEVSRRHAYLQAVGGRLFCLDLGSRSRVLWPDGPRESGWVEWGKPLRIGPYVIQITRPRERALILQAEASTPSAPAEAVFEVDDGTAPVRWRMHDLIALAGGAAACKVRLRHTDVSQLHCSLVRGPLGVWVVDLLSRSGTRVNGRLVPWARLAEGDQVQLGPFGLRLLESGPRSAEQAIVPVPRGMALAPDPSLLPVVHEFNRMQEQMLEQFHQTMMMMAEMFTTLHREQSALVRGELEQMRQLTQELQALQVEQEKQAAAPPDVPATAPEDEEFTFAPFEETPATEEAPNGAPAQPAASEADCKPVSTTPPENVHYWLSQRLQQLRQERHSRWQRILQIITGGKGA